MFLFPGSHLLEEDRALRVLSGRSANASMQVLRRFI